MVQNHGFGVFSKLPYELREQIWLEFLPVGQEDRAVGRVSPHVDLRVLLASRDLHEEVSTILYSRTCLHFNISPKPGGLPLWTHVYFKSSYQKRICGGGIGKAVWKLESEFHVRDHRFDNFPFPKIERIEVSIPTFGNPNLFFWVWRNIITTSEMLQEASSISTLVIQPQVGVAGLSMAGPSIHAHGTLCSPNRYIGNEFRLDLEVLTLPFFLIPHLKYIKIEFPPKELSECIIWQLYDWAADIYFERNENYKAPDEECWKKTGISDYWWAFHQLFMSQYRTRRPEKIDFTCTEWICKDFDVFSKFKGDMLDHLRATF